MNRNTDFLYKSKLPSGLYIVATPIGNLQDITLRAIEILKNVDIIYCEDKRQSSVLLSHHGIQTSLGSYHEHNAEKMRPEIIEKITKGAAVALISDAGTPLISDPGYKLVAKCRDAGLSVIPVPGSSAPIAALSASGLSSDHFYFGGFLPAKEGERKRTLEEMRSFPHTLIFFEAPRRLLETLRDVHEILGNRQVCVARELTKTFEEIRLSSVAEMIVYYEIEGVLKGEMVLLIEGEKEATQELTSDVEEILRALVKSYSTKEAAQLLAGITGLSKKVLYDRALELKHEGN